MRLIRICPEGQNYTCHKTALINLPSFLDTAILNHIANKRQPALAPAPQGKTSPPRRHSLKPVLSLPQTDNSHPTNKQTSNACRCLPLPRQGFHLHTTAPKKPRIKSYPSKIHTTAPKKPRIKSYPSKIHTATHKKPSLKTTPPKSRAYKIAPPHRRPDKTSPCPFTQVRRALAPPLCPSLKNTKKAAETTSAALRKDKNHPCVQISLAPKST